jgi:hypothetical protein
MSEEAKESKSEIRNPKSETCRARTNPRRRFLIEKLEDRKIEAILHAILEGRSETKSRDEIGKVQNRSGTAGTRQT